MDEPHIEICNRDKTQRWKAKVGKDTKEPWKGYCTFSSKPLKVGMYDVFVIKECEIGDVDLSTLPMEPIKVCEFEIVPSDTVLAGHPWSPVGKKIFDQSCRAFEKFCNADNIEISFTKMERMGSCMLAYFAVDLTKIPSQATQKLHKIKLQVNFGTVPFADANDRELLGSTALSRVDCAEKKMVVVAINYVLITTGRGIQKLGNDTPFLCHLVASRYDPNKVRTYLPIKTLDITKEVESFEPLMRSKPKSDAMLLRKGETWKVQPFKEYEKEKLDGSMIDDILAEIEASIPDGKSDKTLDELLAEVDLISEKEAKKKVQSNNHNNNCNADVPGIVPPAPAPPPAPVPPPLEVPNIMKKKPEVKVEIEVDEEKKKKWIESLKKSVRMTVTSHEVVLVEEISIEERECIILSWSVPQGTSDWIVSFSGNGMCLDDSEFTYFICVCGNSLNHSQRWFGAGGKYFVLQSQAKIDRNQHSDMEVSVKITRWKGQGKASISNCSLIFSKQ